MMRTPGNNEDESATVILEPETGYALATPLGEQEPPSFWDTPYGKYAMWRIQAARQEHGIVVADDMLIEAPQPESWVSAFDTME